MLREIEISRCNCLENLFPTNPMRLIHHLERLSVTECDSIEEIFNIDLGCDSDVEPVGSLRRICVSNLKKLRHVWRIKGDENNSSLIHGFEAVEKVEIYDCKSFENVFTPTNTKFDMRALKAIRITGEVNEGVEVIFEIEDQDSSPSHTELFPNLQHLQLSRLKRMSHVWKCYNWNKFSSLQKQSSAFQNLTTIYIEGCDRLKYLFSPLMAKLLSNLKTIYIFDCNGMEEVVSNRDDKDEEMTTTIHTTTTFFPHLHSLEFGELKNLKVIGGVNDEFKFSQVGVLSWSLCQYSREIEISGCAALSRLIPCYAAGQMQNLQVLYLYKCESLTELFETQGMNNNNSGSDIDEGNGGDYTTTLTIPRLENINVPQLFNLKKVVIMDCNLLKYVFTFSSLESLTQLEELRIVNCKEMKVIVNKENGDKKGVVVFPRLKCVELSNLPNLNGFFLGMNEFQWPLLEKVTLNECSQMMVFTSGQSTTPKLRHIHTRLGKHSLECGLNFHLATDFHETRLPSSEGMSLCSTTSKPLPIWSFYNLIEVDVKYDGDVKCIIPSNELQQLQKLERMRVYDCSKVEEVFEVDALMEGTTQTVVQIPNLTQIQLSSLSSLKHIWKSNHHHHEGRILKFPNLTTLYIDDCRSLKHVFTSSMVGSLQQLQDLHISRCKNLEVIVKEEKEEESECDVKVKEIVTLPCLKSLKLKKLKNLKGFYLGKKDLSWPSLYNMEIIACPEITVFTKGHVTTPALNMIDTSFGRCDLREDINSFIETKLQEVTRRYTLSLGINR